MYGMSPMTMRVDSTRHLAGELTGVNNGEQARMPRRQEISSGMWGQTSPPTAASAPGSNSATIPVDADEEAARKAVFEFIAENDKPPDQRGNVKTLQEKAELAAQHYVDIQLNKNPPDNAKIQKAFQWERMASAGPHGTAEAGEYFASKKRLELIAAKLALEMRIKQGAKPNDQESNDLARLIAETRRRVHRNIGEWSNAVQRTDAVTDPHVYFERLAGEARAKQTERYLDALAKEIEGLVRRSHQTA
jgi:hypothetical protein